jgi:hypothetical protein
VAEKPPVATWWLKWLNFVEPPNRGETGPKNLDSSLKSKGAQVARLFSTPHPPGPFRAGPTEAKIQGTFAQTHVYMSI